MKFSMFNNSLKVASRSNPSGKTRSRPLLVKPSLPTSGRAPASLLQGATSSTTAIATRRSRIPARARANVDIIFRGVPDIREDHDVSHSADAPQPAACSSNLEDDVTSLILSALAESTDGQSNDPAYFSNLNNNAHGRPETHCTTEHTTIVEQVDLSGDDLPDFDEDEYIMETSKVTPPQVQSPSEVDETEVCSDAEDSDPAPESLFESTGLYSGNVSSIDAGSFLGSILSPQVEEGLFRVSPHFDGLAPYDPEAYLDDPDFALEMACLFPPSLTAHSPIQSTKRKRSESHQEDTINASSEAQKRACIRFDEKLNAFQPVVSSEPILHVTTTDMDTSLDIVDVASPIQTSPVVIHDTSCDVPVPPLGISQRSDVLSLSSLWTFRENVPLIKNEHDILGIYPARYEDCYSEEIQDMDIVDPAMDILNGLFSSKLRLDVCTGCQITKAPFCQCRQNDASVAYCDDCSSPFFPHCSCIPYSSHRLPPPHPLIRPPFHVPYSISIRTMWHGAMYTPMDVDEGMSVAELNMLVLSVPNSNISLDRRRRQRKESRSWRYRYDGL